MTKWKLLTLDVWGNTDDGYEVNDVRNQGIFEMPKWSSNKVLLAIIDDMVGISHPDLAEIEWLDESFIEIRDSETGMPIFHCMEETV